MSVVIVGGNECMAGKYESICREHGCKAKVFTKENGSLKKKVGTPDLLILFISTVSHKMALSVIAEGEDANDAAEGLRALLAGAGSAG